MNIKPLLTPNEFWKRLAGAFNGHRAAEARVLGVEEFHHALHREWSRGQRIALPVSLVVVSVLPELAGADNTPLQEFMTIVAGRLRCTDVLGWHTRDRLGLLLPHTHGQGAWCLVEDVRGRIRRPDLLEVKVFASS